MGTPAATKREVIERLHASRRPIVDTGVRKLALFGSFVAGEVNQDSDVDMLVEFDPAFKNYDNFWNLSELLEQTLNRPVDLLTIESLGPHLKPRILAEVEYVPLGD